MSAADPAARLAAALAGRYAIERELGHGGMATVYLAQDLRLGRRVAIKALRPELAVAVGPDRFLREIHVAATLNHPNILPLHDSGEADDVLYYVMPFVEGESLAARLRRDRPLPIDEAIGIARQVALALAAAHKHGIVHRDIKPDNILLDGERALVADFGIAHALGGTAQEKLTTTGLIVGTPTYMSPEQIGGSLQIDGRSDIYSLGCVVYEMLVGEPPYGGPSVQVILARHAAERLPSLRTARSTVPPALELVVHRAMAKAPADRYRDATQFAAALDEALVAPRGLSPSAAWVRPARWTAIAVVGAAAVGIVAASLARRNPRVPPATSRQVVAVLPFERAASGDSSLQRISGEIAGLIAERLTGEGGPRAVSTGTVNEALVRARLTPGQPISDDRALRMARELGAGSVLTGRAAADQNRIILTAALLSAADGSVIARVEPVSMTRDSVLAAADRVTAELLVRASGEPLGRLPELRTERIEVLRTYLAGRLAYVRGQTELAATRFAEAAAADSSFPYAPLGLAMARGLAADDSLARATRGRLSPADQLFLQALVSVRPDPASEAEVIRGWENAVQNGAGYPEAWFKLSEELFHRGPLIGTARAVDRAVAGYREALKLEPGFVPALGHLIDIAAGAGDTAAVRSLGRRYLALDSIGDLADYYRWRLAVSLGDTAVRRQIRARMEQLSDATLERIVLAAQLDGTALDDAEAAVMARRSQSTLASATRLAYLHIIELALNRGRPGAAARLVAERNAATHSPPIDRLMDVVSALFSAGDTVAAARAALEGAAPGAVVDPADPGLYRVCAAGLWFAGRREFDAATRIAQQLRRGRGGQPPASPVILCAATIEAQTAAGAGVADAGERVARLDSLTRVNAATTSWIVTPANLVVADLRERRGQFAEALAAARRRSYIADVGEHRILVALPAMLRAEGRLAAQTGDTAGAIRAYRHYLALLAQPEPALRPAADSVRRSLAALGAS